MLRFQVLGPLEVFDDERLCTPTPPKVRRVLALLLLRANRVVAMDSLIEELWGENPPLSATGTAQTYIYQLRKFLDPVGRHDSEWLVTRPPGYLTQIAPEQLDATEFESLSRQGLEQLQRGRAWTTSFGDRCSRRMRCTWRSNGCGPWSCVSRPTRNWAATATSSARSVPWSGATRSTSGSTAS
jgi:DNA-binding winged helix-turn-helix (wHTH) protein